MNLGRSWLLIRWALAWVLLACGDPSSSWAMDGMDDIMQAFGEVAEKGADATPRAQALALKHNEMLQHLAINGKIPSQTFQANQANFDQIVDGQLQSAAAKNGVKYTPQLKAPGKVPTPGVDTDAIVGSLEKGKPITAQQVNNTRADFDAGINDFLKKNGVAGGPAPKLNTSVLPDPGSMSRTEWQKAIDAADAAGEVVYKNPTAAAAEAKIRAGKPLTVSEANARVSEVQRLANEHFSAADKMDDAARSLPPGPQREAMKAQAQITRHNGAKYVNRITETGEHIAAQNKLPSAGQGAGKTLTTAAVRDAKHAKEAAAAGAMNQHYVAQATQSYVENLAAVANQSKNPGTVAQAKDSIAKALNGLSPAQQGNLIDGLRKTNGDQFAKDVAKTMRTLPKPAPTGPAVEGKFQKAMKVLGPILLVYEGGKRITEVGKAEDASHEAGKQLGGFVGGVGGAAVGAKAGAMAGGWAGGALGAKIGVLIAGPAGAAVGAAIGGTVGGLAGGVYGGMKGYGYGSAHGTEMGDTNSKYWDKNKSQEAFNKVARDNHLSTPDEVYKKLIGMGVSPADARQAAEDYEKGSLKAFSDQLRGLREKMLKENKWSPKNFRHFSNLGTNEVSELLHCLCSASLGANPWVAQGYNLNIPPGYDPKKHSCGSLGNGPCMAEGFGCWRRFIDLSSDGARECMESFGLDPKSPHVFKELDKYNEAVEEPFTLEVQVEPREVCPGDKIRVTATAQGGRGRYIYRYEGGSYLTSGIPEGETKTTSFTMTVDPTLTRGGRTDERGYPIYSRPAESYNTYIQIVASTDTVPGRQHAIGWSSRNADPYGRTSGVRQYTSQMIGIKLRSHAECQKLHPEPKEPVVSKTPPARAPVAPAPRTPSTAPASPPGIAPAPPAPTTTTPPYLPPPKRKTGSSAGAAPAEKGSAPKAAPKGKSSWPAEPTKPDRPPPEDETECWVSATGYGTPEKENTFTGIVREGRRVRITVTGPSGSKSSAGETEASVTFPYEGGAYTMRIIDLDQPECVEEQTVEVPGVEESEPTGTCDECLSIGGSTQASGSGTTDAAGRTTSMGQMTQSYWVEGCEGQTVQITAKGSDGWSATAKGVNERATITRTIGAVAGVDVITVENLSISNCSRTMKWPFRPADGLQQAEPASQGTVTGTGKRTLDSLTAGREEKTAKTVAAGLESMQASSQMQKAATAGDEQLHQAKSTLDSGGQEANKIRSDSAVRVSQQEGKSVLVESMIKGVEQGLVTTATTLGAGIGEEAGSAIFAGKSKPEPAPSAETAAPSGSGSSAKSPSPGGAKKTSASSGSPAPTTAPASPGQPPLVETEQEELPVVAPTASSTACDFCGTAPASSVTTVEGSTVNVCGKCKSDWTCTVCGKVAQDIGGASYNAHDASGATIWSGSINRACVSCRDKWMSEQKAKWEE